MNESEAKKMAALEKEIRFLRGSVEGLETELRRLRWERLVLVSGLHAAFKNLKLTFAGMEEIARQEHKPLSIEEPYQEIQEERKEA